MNRNEKFFAGNMGRAAGQDAPLLVTFVRILAITDSEQQESKLNLRTEHDTRRNCHFAHEQDDPVQLLPESRGNRQLY